MPNRIIKESICTSDSLAELSWFEQNVFFRLIVLADDYGIYDARPAIIRGRAYPLHSVTDKQISDALSKLATVDMIYLYTVGGKPYLQLKTWGEHQQIRATKSKYPKPDEADLQTSDINCNQMISSDSKCPRNPIQSNPNPNTNPKPNNSGRATAPTKGLQDNELVNSSLELREAVNDWLAYKDERRESYKPTGRKSLLSEIKNNAKKCGDAAVAAAIRKSMASNYMGIVFPNAENTKSSKTVSVSEHPEAPTQEETEHLKQLLESMKEGSGE